MDRHLFLKEAIETGSYRTPQRVHRTPADRLLGWFDPWCYIHIARLVIRGSHLAKRGLYNTETWIDQSAASWEMVEGCGGRIELSGLENIRETPGPKVFISNHMSLLETFLMPSILASFGSVAIVVKEQLLTHTFFGPLMRAVDPIGVTRTNPRRDFKEVMTKGAEALGQGRSVLIFPQSTRATVFDPVLFNSLGTRLADRGRVPLLPIALKTDFMGIGRIVKDFGKIHRDKVVYLKVGKAIAVEGDVRKAQQYAVDFISSNLLAWGGTVAKSNRGGEK